MKKKRTQSRIDDLKKSIQKANDSGKNSTEQKKNLEKQISDLDSKVQDCDGILADLNRVTKGNQDKLSQQTEAYEKNKIRKSSSKTTSNSKR